MDITSWKQYIDKESFGKKIEIWIKDNTANEKQKEFDQSKYAVFYFLSENGDVQPADDDPVRKQDKSSNWVEEKIMEIAQKDKWEAIDILRILAWKTGKINHIESNKEKAFRYKDKDCWSEKDLTIRLPYQEKISNEGFCGIAKKIIDLRNKFCNNHEADKCWKEMLQEISLRGLGTTYLITILSFITKFEYPIFDRFAMASLIALDMKDKGLIVPVGSIIKGCSLPEKKDAMDLLDENSDSIYMKYKKTLDEKFTKWHSDRTVDQSLWAYGHMFEVEP